jgi:hypothetical protein
LHLIDGKWWEFRKCQRRVVDEMLKCELMMEEEAEEEEGSGGRTQLMAPSAPSSQDAT